MIINVSIYYTSSLILKIIVTTTPTTANETPASNNVTVEISISPKTGRVKLANVCVKKGLPNTTEPIPVKTTRAAPTAATILKSTGIPRFTVSISKASNISTKLDAKTSPPTNPPPGLL